MEQAVAIGIQSAAVIASLVGNSKHTSEEKSWSMY
jgi:hypothetical protein